MPVVGIFLMFFGASPLLQAAGSPPLITDDPNTPGAGHWESNFGLSTEKRPGARSSEFPLIDINYGIGERLQLRYEVPYLYESEDGSQTLSGFGNSAFGVKWRFYDAGEGNLSVSVYPQVEVNNPGSSSKDTGLVEEGTVFLLPFQFAKEVGPVALVWQIGREFHSDADSWFYGISAGRSITEQVGVAVELAGSADEDFERSSLIANCGLIIDLSEHLSLMFSAGRELHNDDEPRATFIGFIGLQWVR